MAPFDKLRGPPHYESPGLLRGESAHPLHWFLRRGFKHCFVVVLQDTNWILVDGFNGVPVIRYMTQEDGDFDMAAYCRGQGYTVVETAQRPRPFRAPMIHANCVGMVKAVLALRAPFALTPYALYRHLLKEHTA